MVRDYLWLCSNNRPTLIFQNLFLQTSHGNGLIANLDALKAQTQRTALVSPVGRSPIPNQNQPVNHIQPQKNGKDKVGSI